MRSAALLIALTLSGAASAGELEDRGHYLVDAADCQPCHTKQGGQPFAGGRAIPTPFGTLYSANLSADPEHGIGHWTPDQFYRAMHEGIDDEGHHLYPAFPYNYFTRLKREDTDAILAYLKTLPSSPAEPPRNELHWPFSMRWLMVGWNMLFFKEGEFKPDPSQSPEWNRGAYLVEGAAHCGACHTPLNSAGAPKNGEFLQGGRLGRSFAPDLTGNQRTGLGSWSKEDIVAFLKNGRNGHGNAASDMSEVVEQSTSKLTDADLAAIATYLQKIPPSPDQTPQAPPPDQMKLGQAVFADVCSACHQTKADGVPSLFPPLAGNAAVQQKDAATMLQAILEGSRTAATDRMPTAPSMPAYDWKLSDAQIAAVATYIRNAWGNRASAVRPEDVGKLRAKKGD
jgi:mono/diheme cytochrome c family protein